MKGMCRHVRYSHAPGRKVNIDIGAPLIGPFLTFFSPLELSLDFKVVAYYRIIPRHLDFDFREASRYMCDVKACVLSWRKLGSLTECALCRWRDWTHGMAPL